MYIKYHKTIQLPDKQYVVDGKIYDSYIDALNVCGEEEEMIIVDEAFTVQKIAQNTNADVFLALVNDVDGLQAWYDELSDDDRSHIEIIIEEEELNRVWQSMPVQLCAPAETQKMPSYQATYNAGRKNLVRKSIEKKVCDLGDTIACLARQTELQNVLQKAILILM